MTCKVCGCWMPVCKCNGNGGSFYTSAGLYNFDHLHLGKFYRIGDKKQWKRFMKQKGLVQITEKEFERPNFNKPTYKPIPKEELAKDMMKQLYQTGKSNKLVPELRNALGRR